MAGDEIASSEYIVAKYSKTQFENRLDWISDFCSSILVKETRQAIKSRQFFMTFMLLLALVIVWTFFALSPARTEYNVDSLGSLMLCGFLWILGLPLVLIIPYTTFRSLAQEYEDGTIDMVLITTMKPYQIIAGKLGSAMLQVAIYLSILAPCICFCYLLRGIDISQIYLAIGGALIVTFGLNCLAIALASAADSTRVIQVLSVFLILGLLFSAGLWCGAASAICFNPIPASQIDLVSLILSGPFLAVISTAVILFFAAAAKISFASSNRSTMIRIGVTAQIVLYLGWVIAAMAAITFDKIGFMFASVFSMQYLLLVGSMMIACHPVMSPRVRRSLPSTRMKRTLFSLYVPGPGRAFLFTVGLAIGISLSLAVLAIGHEIFNVSFGINVPGSPPQRQMTGGEVQYALMTILANFVFFLFFFCMVFILSRVFAWRSVHKKPFVIEMAILAAVLVFLATIGSYGIAPRVFADYSGNFEVTQMFNWYRIQYFAADKNIDSVMIHLMVLSMFIIPMLFFCIRISAPEFAIRQAAIPQRILDENEELKREQLWGRDVDEETIDEIFAATRPGQAS